MLKTLKWLSVVTTIGMMFVLLGGALVTKTGSGEGCGDSWPLCEGQLVPSVITAELVIEFSHRLVSGVVGITVILLSILAWKYIGHIREMRFLAVMSVAFLILQALLGAAVVMWGQHDFIMAAHFGISLISFAAVFLLTLLIFEIDKKLDTSGLLIKKKHRIEIYALSIFTMIVVYTGALVRHTEANLVCADWPFCNNAAPFDFASYSTEQWIQMGHRLMAGILFIWTILFFIKVMKNYRVNKVMYFGWMTALGLICLQVFFGAMIIFTLLNLGVALLHALVITLYFSVLCYFILLSSRSAKPEQIEAKKAKDSTAATAD
ncbi:heme A synthase [Virgibacillus oceani]